MEEATTEALEGSIDKWEKVKEGTGLDKASNNCPLCQLFMMNACEGCPVKDATGVSHCDNTPYERWSHHHYVKHKDKWTCEIYCSICTELAQEELDFLKSLREK